MNKKLQQDRDNFIIQFVDDVNMIINCFWQINKKEETIIKAKELFSILRKENPEFIVSNSGPYIWKYRKEISSGDVNTLLNNDFKEEIIEIRGNLPDCIDTDLESFIFTIKKTWRLFKPMEQEIIKKKLKNILSIYSGYVAACKQLKSKD